MNFGILVYNHINIIVITPHFVKKFFAFFLRFGCQKMSAFFGDTHNKKRATPAFFFYSNLTEDAHSLIRGAYVSALET